MLIFAAEWDIYYAKKFLDDFALLQIVLITPQPIYYWTVESIKLGSEFGDVYYPNGW